MSHVKQGGTTKNDKDSPGRRLGVKVFAGQRVRTGTIIVRQVGRTKIAGPGTKTGRDHTIYAARDGVVEFRKSKVQLFSGLKVPRVQVLVR